MPSPSEERDRLMEEVDELRGERDIAMRELAEEVAQSIELRRALGAYADHQSWRCGHPDRYPHDPDCPCGLVSTLTRLRVIPE